MKNINMKKLILEEPDLSPNSDKFPIKPYGDGQYEFGLRDNLLVYRSKGEDGKFGKWLNYGLSPGKKSVATYKKELYGINDKESADAAYERQRNQKNSGNKQKCLALKTPPAGLTLNIKNPNDKNYIYGKVGEEWFAQNVKNKKIFNLTKCNYTTSIANLEKLNPSTAKASVEDLKTQSVSIQQSAGLPETGSFDVASLEKLIAFLSDEERPKVQSVNSLVQAGIQPSKAGASITQVAPPQTITK